MRTLIRILATCGARLLAVCRSRTHSHDLRLIMSLVAAAAGMAGPFALFFVPKGSGGGAGGQAARDAAGNDVKLSAWLKEHKSGDRTLVQGLKGDATYLVTNDSGIENYGINAVCTHLGCVVPWNAAENKFMCPCHGSQYNFQGKVVRGPAPLSLALAHADVVDDVVTLSPWYVWIDRMWYWYCSRPLDSALLTALRLIRILCFQDRAGLQDRPGPVVVREVTLFSVPVSLSVFSVSLPVLSIELPSLPTQADLRTLLVIAPARSAGSKLEVVFSTCTPCKQFITHSSARGSFCAWCWNPAWPRVQLAGWRWHVRQALRKESPAANFPLKPWDACTCLCRSWALQGACTYKRRLAPPVHLFDRVGIPKPARYFFYDPVLGIQAHQSEYLLKPINIERVSTPATLYPHDAATIMSVVLPILNVLPLPFRRILALELLFGRRALSLSSHSLRLLSDALAWLYKPVGRRSMTASVSGRRLRMYHVLLVGALSAFGARWLHNRSKQPRKRMKKLRAAMDAATSYEEWHKAAEALEALDESQLRVKRNFNAMYDADLIRGRVEYLKKIQARGDPYELMFVLRSDLIRNAGNIADATTSIQPPTSLPTPIREYISLTKACLRDISSSPLIPQSERLAFLRCVMFLYDLSTGDSISGAYI